jgi:hypothetical protein
VNIGKKENDPMQEEQGRGDTTTQISSENTLQEAGPPKRPIIHTGGPRKKAKAHKQILEYTIIEDDVDLVADMLYDHAVEDFEEAKNQRGRIKNDFSGIKKFLEHIQAAQMQERGIEPIPRVTEEEDRTT